MMRDKDFRFDYIKKDDIKEAYRKLTLDIVT